MREILFYQTDFGDKPVEEFLTALAPPPRAKIVRTLEILRTMPNVPGKFWQKMSGSGKLWEVRTEWREYLSDSRDRRERQSSDPAGRVRCKPGGISL